MLPYGQSPSCVVYKREAIIDRKLDGVVLFSCIFLLLSRIEMDTPSRPSSDSFPPDMRNAIGAFDTEAKRIVATFLTRLESRQTPPIVYHYTDDMGLRGILESGRVWLTDIFSLNDPSELRHGLSRIVAILNEKAASGPPESQQFAELFRSLGQGLSRSAHYFVCSFSETGDDLGQWRAYADNGRGYALGFDAQALEQAFGKGAETSISNRAAFPVTYGDVTLDDIEGQIIGSMFALISGPHGRNLAGSAIREYIAELATALASNALHAALFFKHEAYSNEREYRFLEVHRADAPPAVKLRSRPYRLIRYRDFDWKTPAPAAPKKIVVGPASDPETGRRFALDCAREFLSSPVDIILSRIPYRAS